MALTKNRLKTPVGMQLSYYYPIDAKNPEPAAGRPYYLDPLDMGAAVKGYLSVTTASASIPGDDISQLEVEEFVSGQLDAETTMSDLEVNAHIYGHTYTEEAGEISKAGDVSPNGGYAFIEPILRGDKVRIYRATGLFKVAAMSSAEKQEADTKKSGELAFKNNAVSYKILPCNSGEWRVRKDFETLDAAKAFLATTFTKKS